MIKMASNSKCCRLAAFSALGLITALWATRPTFIGDVKPGFKVPAKIAACDYEFPAGKSNGIALRQMKTHGFNALTKASRSRLSTT